MPQPDRERKQSTQHSPFSLIELHVPYVNNSQIPRNQTSFMHLTIDEGTGMPNTLVYTKNDGATTLSARVSSIRSLPEVGISLKPGDGIAIPFDLVSRVDGMHLGYNTTAEEYGLRPIMQPSTQRARFLPEGHSLVVGNDVARKVDMASPDSRAEFAVVRVKGGEKWLVVAAAKENTHDVLITPHKASILERGGESGDLHPLSFDAVRQVFQQSAAHTQPVEVTSQETDRLVPGEIEAGFSSVTGNEMGKNGPLSQVEIKRIAPDTFVLVQGEKNENEYPLANVTSIAINALEGVVHTISQNASIQTRAEVLMNALGHANNVLKSHGIGASGGLLQFVHMPDGSTKALCLLTGNMTFLMYYPNDKSLYRALQPYGLATHAARRDILKKPGITPNEINDIWQHAAAMQGLVDWGSDMSREPDAQAIFSHRGEAYNHLGHGAEEQPTSGQLRIITVLPGEEILMVSGAVTGALSFAEIQQTLSVFVPNLSLQDRARAVATRASMQASSSSRNIQAPGFGVLIATNRKKI